MYLSTVQHLWVPYSINKSKSLLWVNPQNEVCSGNMVMHADCVLIFILYISY